MANLVCPNCGKNLPFNAERCPKCGKKLSEGNAVSDQQKNASGGEARKKAPSLGAQIFAGGAVGVVFLTIGLGFMEPARETAPPRLSRPSVSQISSPSVDDAAEMETCKMEINRRFETILEWRWGELNTFGERRVRRATIRYEPFSGPIRVDEVVCTFDEPPVGNDFFINR